MRVINGRFHYFVEGSCEQKLVTTLIRQQMIIPGKPEVFNPIQDHLKTTHLRRFSFKTNIILIFDMDKSLTNTLQENLEFLHSQPNIKNVFTVLQDGNLEDELMNCTDIRTLKELLNCSHNSDFKSAFIAEKRLFEKLQSHHFDFQKLWSSPPLQPFLKLGLQNQGNMIKL